ncbi:MAG: glycoside hydrolase family 2 [Acidobacteria bacterium]|nr:MAG: glycoside hydrolase family 2 [Acidobacteriota bacterium]
MRELAALCALTVSFLLSSVLQLNANPRPGNTADFDEGWRFHLGDVAGGQDPGLDDSQWRLLDLPHDWSIEGEFSEKNPAMPEGGALPGGVGWYRKTFNLPASDKGRLVFVDFDGVYRNSEVWINGHYLGKRPYGYISFEYELSPYVNYGSQKNLIAVRVDNSQQPYSRWYSGSGIYRNVWLTTTGKVFVDHWGTYITTPQVSDQAAGISIKTKVRNDSETDGAITLRTIIYDASGRALGRTESREQLSKGSVAEVVQELSVARPVLWSLENPYLYKAVSEVLQNGKVVDRYETPFGVRYFVFDREKGFILNGRPVKIRGVCDHHDLGSLGAAVNTRALERQLEILKAMGANAVRTSHNPPAPELLELCDRMGFVVMDEAFDMWKKKKTEFDYHLDWDEWHRRDLEDMLLRDRNHPSVFIWSIGNEIEEQRGDSSGVAIARELAGVVRSLDRTRPITSACNHVSTDNQLIKSGALDLVGVNYSLDKVPNLPSMFPGQKFIGSETTSALATRGSYDMPSDEIRRWPAHWDSAKDMNADYSCSSYDNCSARWGETHEEAWKVVKKYDYFSGMFIWTGFDYLGEPTPYHWPARSSYFGIVDLAGFPKDAYYMYQSEWTKEPVLHLFPHWNWQTGQTVDVWAYFNTEEVELFLNGRSLGVKRKSGDELHAMWRVRFEPGTLRAVARTGGRVVLTDEVPTAGRPAKIILVPDRRRIRADGKDLSFVTVKVVDDKGALVPDADNLVKFQISGEGFIAGVDNGSQTSHEPFKADYRKAFHGMCLAVVRSKGRAGRIKLDAVSDGLQSASAVIEVK